MDKLRFTAWFWFEVKPSFGSREIRFLQPAFKPQGTDHKGSGDLPDSDMKIVAGTTCVPEEPTGQELGTKLMGIHAKLSQRGHVQL